MNTKVDISKRRDKLDVEYPRLMTDNDADENVVLFVKPGEGYWLINYEGGLSDQGKCSFDESHFIDFRGTITITAE